jgi:hypothetical protein
MTTPYTLGYQDGLNYQRIDTLPLSPWEQGYQDGLAYRGDNQWVERARDEAGRFAAKNATTIATKAAGAVGGIAGGAVAGPVGALVGQAAGLAIGRVGATLVEEAMKGDDLEKGKVADAMMRGVQKVASDARAALQGVNMDNLENEMSRDLIGWGIAHAGSYALDMLVPGASAIPLKGMAVAVAGTKPIHSAKNLAKQRLVKPA